jgi:hypothetical protein
MSFAAIATLLPQIIQLTTALDGLVVNAVNSMNDEDLDPNDPEDMAQMLKEKQASAARRDAALDQLKAAIERKMAGG